MRHPVHSISIVALAWATASCSSHPTLSPGEAGRLVWIDVLPASYSGAELGLSIPFTPVATDANGRVVAVDRFDWVSSAPEVVAVETHDGVGTVLSHGAATVTASVEGGAGAAILLSTPDPDNAGTMIEVVSRADAIRAAVLGVGPLVAQGSYYGCSSPGLWTSFPRGTVVGVRVSTTVTPSVREAIRRALDRVSAVTGGALGVTFGTTSEPNPLPVQDEVTVTAHSSPASQGCASDVGCTLHYFREPGVIRSSRVVLPSYQTANAFVHDALGHGILGMCHVSPSAIGRPQNSLMSNGRGMTSRHISPELSQLDFQLERAVWASSLDPGSDQDDFRRVGLVRP